MTTKEEPTAPRSSIVFTKVKLVLLKAEHARAIKSGARSFVFEGHEFDPGYAGYLIEYLDNQYRGRK